jgi:Kdo2-lipid IVA lauroyltransferase/acyltransferase
MDFLVYLLFLFLQGVIPLFPLKFIQFMARVKGRAFYYIMPIRRSTALSNLRHAFPEKTDDEIRRIVKLCYINVLTVIAEFFYMRKLSLEKIGEFIKVTNIELMTDKLKLNKGLIMISAHFGNWEMTAFGVSQMLGIPLNVVVKEQTNRKVDKAINKLRTAKGNKMIDMRNSLREILSVLKGNGIVAMLGDQAAPKENIKVDFFIKDVPAFEGTAKIAIKTGAAVLFGVSTRDDDGTYSLTLHEIDTAKYKDASDENVKALTQEHVNMLIKYIEQRPDHWLWFHKRFKNVLINADE